MRENQIPKFMKSDSDPKMSLVEDINNEQGTNEMNLFE